MMLKINQPKTKDSIPVHSVKKAVIFSAILPGSGQVYNHLAMPKGQKKAFWKVPLIYAGLGATGFITYKNNRDKNLLRAEYESRTSGNSPQSYLEYDNAGILTLFATARTRRDLFFVGFGIVYLLNILDAGVEAHFVKFDIGEDLSLSFEPTAFTTAGFGI